MFHEIVPQRPLAPYWEELSAKLRRAFQQRRAAREPRPPQETLRRIRKDRSITQDQVAIRLGTTQSEISKLERRSDMLVSTLDAYVEALGGSLDLTVRFPGQAVRIKLAGRELLR